MGEEDIIKLDGAFIAKKDLSAEEIKHINDYEVVRYYKDIGNPGTFKLIPMRDGLKDIIFENGKRVK